MTNGLSNNMKVWYSSKTLWLLFAQLLIEWSFVIGKQMTVLAGIILTMTTVANTIRRFYTNTGVTSKKEMSIPTLDR